MTERKTTGRLSIFRRIDAGNVPAPWVPPELPASSPAAPVPAKRDRTKSVPAPWVPAELPASTSAALPGVAKRDRGKLPAPWVPAAEEAPRNLPAVSGDNSGVSKTGELAAGQLPAASIAPAGTTIINNIVQQVAAPAPVVYAPWWGWWGGCPHRSCPHRVGRPCRSWFCSWW